MSHYTESFNRLVMNTRTISNVHNGPEVRYEHSFFILVSRLIQVNPFLSLLCVYTNMLIIFVPLTILDTAAFANCRVLQKVHNLSFLTILRHMLLPFPCILIFLNEQLRHISYSNTRFCSEYLSPRNTFSLIIGYMIWSKKCRISNFNTTVFPT